MSGNQDQIETGARAITALYGWGASPTPLESARAVLAAIHPTVSAESELDALPHGSAIIDEFGDVGKKLGNMWHFPETAPMGSSRVAKCGDATVLHIPGGAA